MSHRRRCRLGAAQCRGFSYLELVIVIILISTLLYYAIDRLLNLEVQAEQASMQQTLGILQSALGMTIAEHVARDKIPELKKYIGSNPMNLLAEKPVNYRGAHTAEPPDLPGGAWYFDKTHRELVYKVDNTEHFSAPEAASPYHAAFKIVPVYDDNNRNGRFDSGDTLKGLSLRTTAAYRWLNKPLTLTEQTSLPKE